MVIIEIALYLYNQPEKGRIINTWNAFTLEDIIVIPSNMFDDILDASFTW